MQRLHATPSAQVKLPLQVHAELLVGAAKSANPGNARAKLNAFVAPFQIILPDRSVEDHYVAIRVQLEAAGMPISEADLWIAATARAAKGTLVTNNTHELSRVPNLLTTDWTTP